MYRKVTEARRFCRPSRAQDRAKAKWIGQKFVGVGSLSEFASLAFLRFNASDLRESAVEIRFILKERPAEHAEYAE
jgi:hypothetical protein